MKTVQTVLREADRDRLLDVLACNILYDTKLLLELKDRTIADIQEACRNHMNAFVEYLLSLEAVPSDHMVLYMCEASSFDKACNHEDKRLHLIDINEIRQDINASSYGFEFTDWGEAMGYLAADNKLTQDYLYDLLSQFLNELSFFGTDLEERREKVKEVHDELDQAMEDVKAGHTIPAEQVFRELAEEHGFPVDEKDDFANSLKSEIFAVQYKYSRYCHWRERSRILKSIGEVPISFEEAEMRREQGDREPIE